MTTLKPEELHELANAFSETQASIDKFAMESDLSDDSKMELFRIAHSVHWNSQELRRRAAEARAISVQEQVKSINESTKEIVKAAKKLTAYRKTIDLAARMIDLGAAIVLGLNGNPLAIVKAGQEVIKAAKAIPE